MRIPVLCYVRYISNLLKISTALSMGESGHKSSICRRSSPTVDDSISLMTFTIVSDSWSVKKLLMSVVEFSDYFFSVPKSTLGAAAAAASA